MASEAQRREAERNAYNSAEGRRSLAVRAMADAILAYEKKATELNQLTRELDGLRRAKDKAVTRYQEVVAATNQSRGLT